MVGPSDTTPEAAMIILQQLRGMSASAKLHRVAQLNAALARLASARIRAQYGADLPPRELALRLAALRLDAGTMRTVFNWDPTVHGL
jgi:hypothetical protein